MTPSGRLAVAERIEEHGQMILVDQHFRECSFCGRSFPPQWQPLLRDSRLYCSEKCIRFEEVFPEVSAHSAAEPGREEGKHGRSSRN